MPNTTTIALIAAALLVWQATSQPETDWVVLLLAPVIIIANGVFLYVKNKNAKRDDA